MGKNVEDIACVWIDDWQTVDFVFDQLGNGVKQALLRTDGDERPGLVAQPVPPGFESVLLQLLNLLAGVVVVFLQDSDEVRDGQHADKVLPLRIPQRRCSNSIVNQSKECLFYQKLQSKDSFIDAVFWKYLMETLKLTCVSKTTSLALVGMRS